MFVLAPPDALDEDGDTDAGGMVEAVMGIDDPVPLFGPWNNAFSEGISLFGDDEGEDNACSGIGGGEGTVEAGWLDSVICDSGPDTDENTVSSTRVLPPRACCCRDTVARVRESWSNDNGGVGEVLAAPPAGALSTPEFKVVSPLPSPESVLGGGALDWTRTTRWPGSSNKDDRHTLRELSPGPSF